METVLKGINGYFTFNKKAAPAKDAKVTKENALEYYSHVNHGLSDTGYYLDLSQAPIGNRPVHNTYSNYKPFTVFKTNTSGDFNCKQPNWTENCQ